MGVAIDDLDPREQWIDAAAVRDEIDRADVATGRPTLFEPIAPRIFLAGLERGSGLGGGFCDDSGIGIGHDPDLLQRTNHSARAARVVSIIRH